MNYAEPKVFDITKKRPAVLLVGNGLNRCMGDTNTWLNAILRLTKDDGILDSDTGITGNLINNDSNAESETSESVFETESENISYNGTPYIPAEIPNTPIGWAEYCLPSNKAEIARRAILIVEGEGVIERDKLIEKLRNSFGVRINDRVIDSTEKALKFAKIKTTKYKGISYCWASAIDPKTYTSFRYHEDVKRRDDELPLPELRNAVVRTLMDNGPLDENELLVRAARTFGYQRLGPNLRSRLSEGIACAVSDKLIRLNKQKKYELRE